MIKLGVNIDHVATLRQARQTNEPDPLEAAFLAEEAGADGITIHLREDRRHIQDRDAEMLRKIVRTRLNLEMGLSEEIIRIALVLKPDQVTLVPERRQEITTEGGLDVAGDISRICRAVQRFRAADIRVSLFIDAVPRQIRAAARAGAEFIEIHTGAYANAWPRENECRRQAAAVAAGARAARKLGLRVNAGHGLTYRNVQPIAAIPEIEELNIGHSIVSRALMAGFRNAVSEMKRLMTEARLSGPAAIVAN